MIIVKPVYDFKAYFYPKFKLFLVQFYDIVPLLFPVHGSQTKYKTKLLEKKTSTHKLGQINLNEIQF